MRRISVAHTHRYVVASAFVLAAVTLAVGWRRADVHGVAQVTNPPLCDPRFCGNGLMDPGEQCDPADPASGDRCDPLCRLTCENDGDCPSGECAGGLCTDLCGNGTVDPPVCVPEGGGSLVCPPPSPGEVRVVNLPGGVFPLKNAAGDFNKDGKLDIAVMNYMGNEQTYGSPYDGTIEIFLNTGNGTFATRREIGTFRWNDGGGDRGMDVLDVDKDGDADVVFYDSTSSTNAGLFVLRNDNLTFTRVGPVSNYYAFHLSHADVNGDGDQDIGISGFPWATSGTYGAYVQPGAAGASFDTATWLDPSNGYAPPMFADMDGDGDSDVVNVGYKMVEGGGSYVVNVFTNDGNGSFSPPVEMFVMPTSVTMVDMTIADLNNDRKPDVVVANGSNGINVILGDGRGGSASSVTLSLPFRARFVAVADPTADSIPDVIYGSGWGSEGQSLWYAAGKGDGTFESPVRFVTLTPPPDGPGSPPYNRSDYRTFDLLAADYDGDGRMDLSVTHGSYSDSVSVIFFRSSVEGCIEDPPRIVCSQGEECDDGPDNGKSGKCSKQCTYCGNGVINLVNGISEQCDDGNTASGDGCSARCTSEGLACTWLLDDGDPNTPMPHCNVVGTTCQGTAQNGVCCCDANLCGNGVIDIVQGIPEACDDGALNGTSTSTCTSQCTITRPVPTLHLACVGIGQCAIVTGPGPDSCLDAQDCSCDPADPSCTHAACVNNACAQVPGPGMALCSSAADCAPCPDSNPNCHMLCDAFTLQCVAAPEGSCVGDCSEPRHLACIDEQCTIVDGAGTNECESSDDCTAETHLACVGIGQCAIVTGPGPDSCLDAQDCSCDPANPSCTHAACVDNRCIPVPGPGMPLCSSTADCAPCPDSNPNCHMLCDAFTLQCVAAPEGSCVGDCSEPRHLACRNEQCVMVDGAGEHECLSSDDCTAETHLACVGIGQCAIVTGPGPDSCLDAQDCSCDPANPSCTHAACVNNACAQVPGPGMALCSSAADCAPCPDSNPNCHMLCDAFTLQCVAAPEGSCVGDCSEPRHLACRDEQCTIVDGAGEDECASSDDCMLCGNGVVDAGEECDYGDKNGEVCMAPAGVKCTSCSETCSFVETSQCGDDILDDGEACDEGERNRRDPPNDLTEWYCKENSCEISGCFDRGDNDHDGFLDVLDPGCWSYDLTGIARASGPRGRFLGSLLAQSGGRPIRPVPPEEYLPGKDDEACPAQMVDVGQFCALECSEGEICPDGSVCPESGICPPTCGNGIIDLGLGEECDDGNLDDNDACTNQCRLPPCEGGNCPRCGDGVYQSELGEQCDGNDPPNAAEQGCTQNCRLRCTSDNDCPGTCDESVGLCVPAVCGDGEANQDWERCDDGNIVNDDECNNACQPTCKGDADCNSGRCDQLQQICFPTCGNGHLDPDEQCDDGNFVDTDRCTNTCQRYCTDDSTCDCDEETYRCRPLCGNGRVDPGEGCDDGNDVDRDECSNRCQVRCRPGTMCPGNVLCPLSGTCPLIGVCGDGVVGTLEQCDDGNAVDADACTNTCTVRCSQNSECPGGLVCLGQQCGECTNSLQCDSGFCVDGRCRQALPVCGNGVVEAGEVCDDANGDAADECSSNCLFPVNHACTASAQCQTKLCKDGFCQPCSDAGQCGSGLRCSQGSCLYGSLTCGDGVMQAGEACDDANLDDGDTCSSACFLSLGQSCTHALQCSSAICSGGVCIPCKADSECAAGRRCMIGMCLTNAQISRIPNVCGNGTLEEGEQCDDGNNAYGDGCTPLCVLGNTLARVEVAANVAIQMPFGTGPGYGSTLHAGAGDGLSDTGPATVAVMAAGAAAGAAWVRRRRKMH